MSFNTHKSGSTILATCVKSCEGSCTRERRAVHPLLITSSFSPPCVFIFCCCWRQRAASCCAFLCWVCLCLREARDWNHAAIAGAKGAPPALPLPSRSCRLTLSVSACVCACGVLVLARYGRRRRRKRRERGRRKENLRRLGHNEEGGAIIIVCVCACVSRGGCFIHCWGDWLFIGGCTRLCVGVCVFVCVCVSVLG